MSKISKWVLALGIVLFAYYLALVPEFGPFPFWGQRWEVGVAQAPWHENGPWPYGMGMMGGALGYWGRPAPRDRPYGGYGMMDGDAPWAGQAWQANLTLVQQIRIGQIQANALRQEGALQAQLYAARANLLALNSAAKPDPKAQSQAATSVADTLRQLVQIRLQAEQQIQTVLAYPSEPPSTTASGSAS